MYGNALKSLIFLFILPSLAFGSNLSVLSDTIPPEITTFPEDLIVACGVPYQQQFDTWLENHAGLAVSDDGEVNLFNTFSGILEDEILSSSDTLCGTTARIPIGFYALDDCGNFSDTAYANFVVEDTFQPIIEIPAQDKILVCGEGIVDSLQQWLDNVGGAVANEVCSGDVIWNNYIWNDNLGNSGFALLEDTTNIEIIRSSCEWFVDVSFFVLDDCGNPNVTTSSFGIIDTVPPLILNLLTDTLIACVDSIPNVIPNFVDACEGQLELQTETQSTQGSDPNDCSFYNYTVNSSYRAEDICGNQSMVDQVVQVVDTLAPIIVASQEINIDCDDNQSIISTYIDSVIDCSPVETVFVDSLLSETPCSRSFRRIWDFTDVCGNRSNYRQIVNVIDQTGPQIEGPIPSLELECSQIEEMDQILLSFYDNLLALPTTDNCGNGSVYINGGEDPNVINFDFQFIPEANCNGTSVIQQQSVPITLEDDCGNFEQATSSILILDTIAPEILVCTEELNLELQTGECELKIPLQQFDLGAQCDSVRSSYLFKRQIQLDSFTTETGNISFTWEFPEAEADAILEGAKIEFTSEGILNDDLGLDFSITNEDGDELFQFGDPLSFCDEQNFSFDVDIDVTKAWIEAGKIQLLVDYQIPEVFDCVEEARLGFTIAIPTYLDNPIKYFYSLDGEDERSFSEGDSLTISSGIHDLIYIVEDCAGNRDSCAQQIDLKDLELPELVCPEDFIIVIPDDTCGVELTLNPDFQFIENCGNNFNFLTTLPEGDDRFMKFTEQDDSTFVADNIQIKFEEINLDNIILNPVLIVELLANTTVDNGFFSIRDENGQSIGNTPQSIESCMEPISITIDLTLDQLLEWNMDGSIDFNFVNTDISLGGLTPCSPDNFNGQIDMSSFLTATLAFTEVMPSIVVTDFSSGDTLLMDNGKISFPAGEFEVELSSSDNSGNVASCVYNIEVQDITAPQMVCNDIEVEIDIQNDSEINPDISFIDFQVIDNCDSVKLELTTSSIDCNHIGEEIIASLTATDEYDNVNICQFNFIPVGIALEPSFSSSLCGGDTLSLLNNIPNNLSLEYVWTGPSGFSSDEANPQIENASSANSGTYNLEVITEAGCSFFGSVDVTIEALSNPEIESDSEIICEGDVLTLNSNAFDDVVYLWYEGLAPNGILVGMSTDPSFEITPSIGPHYYYSIVNGNGCQSDPSNSHMIEVIEHPEALVTNSFVTACEGESFTLSTENTEPLLEFSWTGPEDYESDEPNPPSIENINLNQQGTYQLIVSDRGCQSDPALVEVVIFNTPDKPILAGENLLCEGSDFSLTVINNVSSDKYNWFLNGSAYSTTNTNSIIIPNAQDQLAGEWTVVVEDDNCISVESDIFVVEIESQITIGANNNGPICEGGTVTLMASFIPEADYVWTTPNNLEFFGRVVSVPAVNGLYTVEVITAAGCRGEANTVVSIIQVPEITALSNNSTDCMDPGDPISFFPSIFPPGNYQYLWTGPNNFASNDENLTIPFQGQASNGMYGLQIQNDNCVSDIIFTEVQATIIPDQPTISQNGPLCLGASINLLASNVSADVDEYIWDTPIGQITTDEPALNISPSSNINIGEYSLTVSVNGCMSDPSEEIDIVLEDALDTPIIIGSTELCLNQTLILEISNVMPGLNYTWVAPDGTNYTGEVLTIDNFSNADSGSYVVQASANACTSDFSVPHVVNLISGPDAPLLSMDQFTFCANSLNSINIENFIVDNEGEFFLYDETGMLLAQSITGNFTGLDLSDYNVGNFQFGVTQSIADCESSTFTPIVISILNEGAPASFQENELIVCEIGSSIISFNIPNDTEINIDIEGDNIMLEEINNNQITINIFDVGSSQIILASSNDQCGEFATDTLSIEAVENVVATDDQYTILGLSNTMLAILDNDQFSIEPSISIENIIGGPQLSVVGNMVAVNTNNAEGIYVFNYTICDLNCPDNCDEASITLDISSNGGPGNNCEPYNLMTPNADGENDFFIVPCTEQTDQVEVKIFNSFGALIYTSDDYQNDWMGTNDGEDVPVGTYYYYVKINNEAPMAAFLVVER